MTKFCSDHPLDPLTPDEIAAATLAVRKYLVEKTEVKAVKFITCYLIPPPKRAVLAALGIPTTPKGTPETPIPIVRKAESDFIDVVNGFNYNVVLSLKPDGWIVDTLDRLSEGVHPQLSVEELVACEIAVRKDKRVQEYAKAIGILPEQIFCDGWTIGYDERFPQKTRVQQGFMYARLSEHENLYAHPLDFSPVVDSTTAEVLHIDLPPHYKQSPNGPVLSASHTQFPPLSADSLAHPQRERITPPLRSFDFLPEQMEKTEPGFKLRDDVKPLHILQPEGVSFSMDGNVIAWQNWKMHISFSHREGIALSTITYNDHGEVRPIIYRLSVAEMVVPYAAPEYPHPRKFAFDSGEYGMGTMANELSLGCDCLGQIHYLPGAFVAHDGHAHVIKNAICIHEEDSGVLWKHTDYREGGRTHTVRRRRLVISQACTVANYDYIFNWHFYQDGTIELEIRLTGVLQLYVQEEGEPNQFGTTMAPKINAHYHQHLFSLRVDPMIDGLNNSAVETDIVPLPDAPTGSPMNFAGNAFICQESVLQKEGGRPYDLEKERRWKITNPSRQHYANGKDVGFSLGLKEGISHLFARPDGWVAKRASFPEYTLWVCKDVEGPKGGRMWPAGKYVPQTRESPEDSISSWVKAEENVENEDILIFATFGTTHIPRPEDFPVMPSEVLHATIKPQSFFDKNPSLDVPGTKDSRSVAAFEESPACHC